MRFRLLLASLFVCLAAQTVWGQKEELFSDLNAYNPVPSPDGQFVAFVRTGRGRHSGSGGFGRSNLISEVKIAKVNGTIVSRERIDSFLGEWLPDASAFVCYRDWHFGLASTKGWIQQGTMPEIGKMASDFAKAERVAFVPALQRFVWIDRRPSKTMLQTPQGSIGEFAGGLPTSDLIVASPDGHYLAVAGTVSGNGFHLMTFDLQHRNWSDFGEVTIHPDDNWDYIKPSWNPWFSDSSHLTYISKNSLYVATPDGVHKEKLAELTNAGLPVASPDGGQIAYVSFTPRPMKHRPDLKFWGGAAVWVIPRSGGKQSRVTQSTDDTTYTLRWLDSSTLLFDRISDTPFYSHARIWKVSLNSQ